MTDGPSPGAELRVDLDALAANHRLLTTLAGPADVAPVVKADAYGLGVGPVARRLWREGARRFFVAQANEALALRGELGRERPASIFVLEGATADNLPSLAKADAAPVLNSPAQLALWRSHGPSDAPAALHLDTGMNRLGLRAAELAELTDSDLSGLKLELVLSHLACADIPGHAMSGEQLALFRSMSARFPGVPRSLSASSGVFLGRDYQFDLVRPGISLYGGGPFAVPEPRLAQVAALTAPILQIADAAPGATVGYGATYSVGRPLRLAVVGLGYADGVLRSACKHGYGWLHGARRSLLGRISMDLCVIDVTDAAEAKVGDRVQFFGPDLALDEAAAAWDTTAYELLTRVGPRVLRRHVGSVS
jgi:alanine racemase